MSEYFNTYVMLDGRAYRVALHQSQRLMAVARKTKHGEVFLKLTGPKAGEVAKIARAQISRPQSPSDGSETTKHDWDRAEPGSPSPTTGAE